MTALRRHWFAVAGLGRMVWRLIGFLAICGGSIIEHACVLGVTGRHRNYRLRVEWTQRVARRVRRCLGIQIHLTGAPPAGGVLACNHLSYLDIVVIGETLPITFLSKHEVRHWPVLGWLARLGGTLFIRRDEKSQVAAVATAFESVIHSGVPLCLFPEGTTTTGRGVLPFKSSLFEPAAAQGWPVTPARLTYQLADAAPATEISFVDDMLFLPHFLKLLRHRRIIATLAFGSPITHANRKQLAAAAHAAVLELAAPVQDSPLSSIGAVPEPVDLPSLALPSPTPSRTRYGLTSG